MRPDVLNSDVLDVLSGVAYVVLRDGTIQSVGSRHWDRFWMASGARGLGPEKVRGRNLFDFIEGEEVRASLRAVLDRLAAGDVAEWVMPYRCDTPTLARNMRLSVTPIVDGDEVAGFLFQSVLLDETARPPVNLFDFDAVSARMKDLKERTFLLMCNWCQRVKLRDAPDRPFVEGPEYYRRGGDPAVAVFHTICPDCKKREAAGFVRH